LTEDKPLRKVAQVFAGRALFLSRKQQHQSIERNLNHWLKRAKINHWQWRCSPYAGCLMSVPSWTAEKHQENKIQLECGPMPNVMAAQPITGDTLCESSVIPFLLPRRKAWLAPAGGVPCSNAANRLIGERKSWM